MLRRLNMLFHLLGTLFNRKEKGGLSLFPINIREAQASDLSNLQDIYFHSRKTPAFFGKTVKTIA